MVDVIYNNTLYSLGQTYKSPQVTIKIMHSFSERTYRTPSLFKTNKQTSILKILLVENQQIHIYTTQRFIHSIIPFFFFFLNHTVVILCCKYWRLNILLFKTSKRYPLSKRHLEYYYRKQVKVVALIVDHTKIKHLFVYFHMMRFPECVLIKSESVTQRTFTCRKKNGARFSFWSSTYFWDSVALRKTSCRIRNMSDGFTGWRTLKKEVALKRL